MNALPMTLSIGTNPRPKRESSEFPRLSPMTKSLPAGTVFGRERLRSFCVRYGSSSFSPLT